MTQNRINTLLIDAFNRADPPLGSRARAYLDHLTERAIERGHATIADVRNARKIAERYPADR